MKRCNKCGGEKPPCDFYSGNAVCKSCYKDKNKAYNLAHREQIAAHRNETRAERNAYFRDRYASGKDVDKYEYYEKNKVALKLKRESLSPPEILRRRLMTSLRRVCTRKGYPRPNIQDLDEMIGVSWEELWEYLKVTWFDNYLFELGDTDIFEIDHIVPCDLVESYDELSWNYNFSNLQLLTPRDNLKKGNRHGPF